MVEWSKTVHLRCTPRERAWVQTRECERTRVRVIIPTIMSNIYNWVLLLAALVARTSYACAILLFPEDHREQLCDIAHGITRTTTDHSITPHHSLTIDRIREKDTPSTMTIARPFANYVRNLMSCVGWICTRLLLPNCYDLQTIYFLFFCFLGVVLLGAGLRLFAALNFSVAAGFLSPISSVVLAGAISASQ